MRVNAIAAGLMVLAVLSGAAVRAEDTLILLSPHPEGIKNEFKDAFKEYYRKEAGREVDVRYPDLSAGTSTITRYIQSEFATNPDGIGIDMYFGGGTDPYLELKRLGLLEPYRVPDDILSGVAPEISGIPLYDKDYTWYAATMAGFGILYNKVVIKTLDFPEPKAWEDLARPVFFGWVGSADPRKSGSVHMCYEIMLQAYGWERGWQIITALGANVRSFSQGAGQTPRDAAVGEIACGPAIDFYAWSQVRESGADLIGYVLPEGLTMVNGDAMAILKGAPHREVAQAFIRFVLSEDGQKLWLLPKGAPGGPTKYDLARLSVRPDLYDKVKDRALVTVNPFTAKSEFTYNATLGSARYDFVNDLIGAFIIDPHERLAATWAKAIAEAKTEAELPRLAAMPLTEEETNTLIKEGRWKDAAFRATTMKDWSALAASRYLPATTGARLVRNLPVIFAAFAVIAMFVYLRRRARR